MELRKFIKNIVLEYITNNEISLQRYLSMSEEERKEYLPHDYHYFFDDFLEETDSDFERPTEMVKSDYENEPDEEVDAFGEDTIELVDWLEENDKKVYDEFANYLYNKITSNELPINVSEYPAWSYFDDSPKIVKNQWLIHFTNDANSIAKEGFKYGVDEMDKLGLTTHLGDFEKKYGGYNFSYLLKDFDSYGHSNRPGEYKYGKEAVIFRASGIKTWHNGDQEPQVIFYGNTATNIIPIVRGENAKYGIYSKKGNLLIENDKLEKIVNWVAKNFQQYRKNFVY